MLWQFAFQDLKSIKLTYNNLLKQKNQNQKKLKSGLYFLAKTKRDLCDNYSNVSFYKNRFSLDLARWIMNF